MLFGGWGWVGGGLSEWGWRKGLIGDSEGWVCVCCRDGRVG